jgi:hypothetical protein
MQRIAAWDGANRTSRRLGIGGESRSGAAGIIPQPRLCKALIDRLTDQAHIITTGSDSYRFRRTTAQRKATKP